MFYIDQRWQNDDFNNNLDVLYIDKVHILFFEKKVHILFFFEGIAMIAMNWRDSNDCPSIHCNHCYPLKKKKVYALCLYVTHLNHFNSVSNGTIPKIAMNISIQWVKNE